MKEYGGNKFHESCDLENRVRHTLRLTGTDWGQLKPRVTKKSELWLESTQLGASPIVMSMQIIGRCDGQYRAGTYGPLIKSGKAGVFITLAIATVSPRYVANPTR